MQMTRGVYMYIPTYIYTPYGGNALWLDYPLCISFVCTLVVPRFLALQRVLAQFAVCIGLSAFPKRLNCI